MRSILTAAILAAFFVPKPVMSHGSYGWVMENPAVSYCCGPQDCRPLRAGELSRRDGRWYINGHMVPYENVHASGAPDARHHACFFSSAALSTPRCLFLPGMM